MLKRFEVKNYKGFKDNIVWDLRSTRDYSFKNNLVRNKIVTAATVFGKNASGKSSLCTALVDITTHLLDVEKDNTPPHLYSYIGSDSNVSEFKYVFQFDSDEVEYYYAKTNNREMVCEIVSINGKQILVHNFIDESVNYIKIPGAENLRTKGLPKQLSVVKYIYNNTIFKLHCILTHIFVFI
jgi:AAA15 family ATPase/GTPase